MLFPPLEERREGVVTMAIGDGGNEAGLGSLYDQIVETIPNGEVIASATVAEHVIV